MSENTASFSGGTKNTAGFTNEKEAGAAHFYNEPLFTYNELGVLYSLSQAATSWTPDTKN